MELILPPYTKGTTRGNVIFSIKDIQWKGRKFNQIELKIFWWGDDFNSHATKIITTDAQFPIALRYKICTSSKLFAAYLRNCEPIEIKIRSAKTQTLVGTVFVPIPIDFVNDEDDEFSVADAKVIVTEKIFSTRNNIIGSIDIEMKMKFVEPVLAASQPIDIPLKELGKLPGMKTQLAPPPVVPPIVITKSSICDKMPSSHRTSRSFYDLNKSDRTILVNYLTGERMTKTEKEYALSELATISPTESLIEALTGHESDKEIKEASPPPMTVLNRDEKKETTDKVCTNCNKNERNSEATPKDEKNKNNDDIHQSDKKDTGRGEGKIKLDSVESNENYITFLDGLIHIGHIDALVTGQTNSSYFIVIQSFWRNTICTQITQTNLFNYLDIFSILCNRDFVEKIKNSFLVLELWERNISSSERLIGQILLPLHKYFIALCDMKLFEHLKKSKMPIISNDGWTSIKSLLSNEIIGQIEILLAIGTKEQIEYLKNSRNLNEIKPLKIPTHYTSVETQTSQVNSPVAAALTLPPQSSRSATVEKLNKFIDSLAHVNTNSNSQFIANQTKSTGVPSKSSTPPQMRRTSELLDMLNYALAQKNPIYSSSSDTDTSSGEKQHQPTIISSSSSCPSTPAVLPTVKVNIDIEHALHLPKTLTRNPNKSKHKRNRNMIETEPNSYATFSTYDNSANNSSSSLNLILKNHDGNCYSTQVIEKSCNPIWNKKFYEVHVPEELLMDATKKFELKVMTKQLNDLPQCRLIPTPMDDNIIGTVKIDLTVLMSGLPIISGYYNIVDFSGRTNGQIKVTIKPLDDVSKNYNKNDLICDNALVTSLLGGQCLSRALKRKFSELDEITQRLKTRLNDVTSNIDEDEQADDDEANDGDDDIDEEFEKDLNTVVSDDDEDDDYNWPNDDDNDNIYCNTTTNKSASNMYTKLESDDSSVVESPSTSLSTLSSDRVKLIADALKNANLSDYEK